MSSNSRIETLILNNLLYNEGYMRRVLPYLKDYYFTDRSECVLFKIIKEFFSSYNSIPSKDAILIELEGRDDLRQEVLDKAKKYIKTLKHSEEFDVDENWLLKKTEDFCKDREMLYAISESVKIIEDPKKKKNRESITELVKTALSVSFDPDIGLDYFDGAEDRFEHYTNKELRIPFGIEYLDRISDGGLPRKALMVIMAGTGVGKTMTMCSLAASFLSQGKNVLYVTMEMSAYEIMRRIDANLHDIAMNDLKKLKKSDFLDKVRSLQMRTNGRVKVKEYPEYQASCNTFRALINELKMKSDFTPDVMVVDYLGVAASAHIDQSARASSTYAYAGSVAHELHGFSKEMSIPIITGHQANREGSKSKKMTLEHSADSMGVPRAASLFITLSATEDPKRVLVGQLKNRLNDSMQNMSFYLGVDRSKQKIYDLEDGQPDLENGDEDDTPGFDKTKFGGRMTSEKMHQTLKKFGGRGKYVSN